MPLTQTSVIVLENDPSLSQAMERVLQASGFHTRAFRSFEELVQADAARDAACLVIDASSAAEHGAEVRALLHIGPRTPVIFISGYDESETHQQVESVGAASFMAKPFSGRLLAETVHRLLLPEAAPNATIKLASALVALAALAFAPDDFARTSDPVMTPEIMPCDGLGNADRPDAPLQSIYHPTLP
jgi:FixJ family two-component response regulator